MKQIIVIGDNSSTNLGDPILTQSAHYVIRNIAEGKGFEVSIFDIAGRKARNTKSPQYPPTKQMLVKNLLHSNPL